MVASGRCAVTPSRGVPGCFNPFNGAPVSHDSPLSCLNGSKPYSPAIADGLECSYPLHTSCSASLSPARRFGIFRMANAGVKNPQGSSLIVDGVSKPRTAQYLELPLLKPRSPDLDPGKLAPKLVLSVAVTTWITGNRNPGTIRRFGMLREKRGPTLSCCEVSGPKRPRRRPGYCITAFGWHKEKGLATLSGTRYLRSVPRKRRGQSFG